MYVTLSLMFLLIFWAGTLLGQQSSRPVDDQESDSMEKRLKMREEMHRRMMDKLLNGIGSDEDLFSDMEKFMDEVMTDSFNGLHSFSRTTSQNYQIEWTESGAGRTLSITPKTPEQQLDINVADGLITIKGKSEHKTPHGVSYSNFSNSFNVPGDCDPSKVKMDQKEGKILVHFPYRNVKAVDINPPEKDERKPLPPSEGDVQI